MEWELALADSSLRRTFVPSECI